MKNLREKENLVGAQICENIKNPTSNKNSVLSFCEIFCLKGNHENTFNKVKNKIGENLCKG